MTLWIVADEELKEVSRADNAHGALIAAVENQGGSIEFKNDKRTGGHFLVVNGEKISHGIDYNHTARKYIDRNNKKVGNYFVGSYLQYRKLIQSKKD